MDALAPAYREVLVLRDVEGLRAAEVAEVTGRQCEAERMMAHALTATARIKRYSR